jgi:hypothetical protein
LSPPVLEFVSYIGCVADAKEQSSRQLTRAWGCRVALFQSGALSAARSRRERPGRAPWHPSNARKRPRKGPRGCGRSSRVGRPRATVHAAHDGEELDSGAAVDPDCSAIALGAGVGAGGFAETVHVRDARRFAREFRPAHRRGRRPSRRRHPARGHPATSACRPNRRFASLGSSHCIRTLLPPWTSTPGTASAPDAIASATHSSSQRSRGRSRPVGASHVRRDCPTRARAPVDRTWCPPA